MEASTAREKLDTVNAIRAQVVALRDDPDEALALRGAFDDLLVPIDSIRRDMAQRIDSFSRADVSDARSPRIETVSY